MPDVNGRTHVNPKSVIPAQKMDCRPRDKKKPCPSAFRHSNPLVEERHTMRPNLTVSPYFTALLPGERDVGGGAGRPHLAITAPYSCIENSYPKVSPHLARGGVGGGPERSQILQLMSEGIPSPIPASHSMFPDGVVNASTSARAGAIARRKTRTGGNARKMPPMAARQ
jgi:hypothetical protein